MLLRFTEFMRKEKMQFLVFGILTIIVVVMASTIGISSQKPYKRFFGNLNPIAVFILTAFIGFICLVVLIKNSDLNVFNKRIRKGVCISAIISSVFLVPIIIVDCFAHLPEMINVLPPESLLFYPSIAYVVEIIFHLLPLTLLYVILRRFINTEKIAIIIWICIVIVSLIEPLFQITFSIGHDPTWKVLYLFLHIWAINLVSLTLFKHYGFVTMYLFRLFYYILWHIVWGAIRLQLFF